MNPSVNPLFWNKTLHLKSTELTQTLKIPMISLTDNVVLSVEVSSFFKSVLTVFKILSI